MREIDGVLKGGLFDAQSGNPWCHKECSRLHPSEVQKMVKALADGKSDEEFLCAKVKHKIATIEKDNTLMHAFAGDNPLVMKIVSILYIYFIR